MSTCARCGLVHESRGLCECCAGVARAWKEEKASAVASAALRALRAFGEAIATIARAQMIARAAIGRTITVDLGARTIELWQHGGSLCVSEYSDRAPRRLREIRGWREDIAAEAVAALIEECER